MTRYEYFQEQLDSITNAQLQCYRAGDSNSCAFLEEVKNNIRKKQLNLSVKDAQKKAGLLYRMSN